MSYESWIAREGYDAPARAFEDDDRAVARARTTLRSHTSVRSYYFREACAERARWLENYELEDFRSLMRKADAQAKEWRRRATNIWNHQTRQWEQRT